MKKIQNRIIRSMIKTRRPKVNVRELVKTLMFIGSWPEIDYENSDRANWKPFAHLKMLESLVLSYKSSAGKNNSTLKNAIVTSLNFWLDHDFINPNWWWNDIGVPMTLGPILLMLDNELTSDQRKKGIKILKRGEISKTGQNLVWLAGITLNRGLLENKPATVKRAFSSITNEIRLSGDEGIQFDFSFHQHGHLLYNHGYGSQFALDCSRIAALAVGTEFAFSKEKLNIISRYILDGSQWMAYGNTSDYSAEGREIARPNHSANYLIEAVEDLLKLPTGRQVELKAMMLGLKNKKDITLDGNRHFWNSDFMTHHRKSFYVSTRMHSDRLLSNDGIVNDEGYKSDFIADGCNYIFRTGDEYKDIFPIWNWQKIPGTTTEQKKKNPFVGNPKREGTKSFVGGVSDGTFGLSSFDFERNSLSAHKSWFYFDKEVVCLGAGITCESKSLVKTTVNQCFLNGDVVVGKKNNRVTKYHIGVNELVKPEFVYHDGVAYIFNEKYKLILKNREQKGSWYSISRTRSKEIIKRDVFELCIDHGRSFENKSYSYIICPAMTLEEVVRYNKEPEVTVLANTSEVQAVNHHVSGLTQIAFFKPDKIVISEEVILSVDKACLVMVQEVKNSFKLTISDPTQVLKVVHVKVSLKLSGLGAKFNSAKNITTIAIDLPSGGYAGKSVVCNFRVKA